MGNSVDLGGRPIHFIGIGGIGMSGLAYVLARRGLPVSGSDLRATNITERLATAGAQIFLTQDASNLDWLERNLVAGQTPQIICSTAISKANHELAAALERGYPIFHRSDVLATLIDEYYSIGVAGTHGKTTTSSAIGYMLVAAGVDPTIVVGGEVTAWSGNACVGKSEYFVAEVDESDGSLVKHSPKIGVITNIELDHPDFYKSIEQTIDTFQTFARQCEVTIGSVDCPLVRERIIPTISYSVESSTADYTVTEIDYHAEGTSAQVYESGKLLGTLKLGVLGKHNLSNALAAVAVGRKIGLDFPAIASGLATFNGAKRRFELKGYQNDITFIDDYAHHPSEILVTLSAARLRVGSNRRVVAVFQPHRYSRTLEFLTEFAQSFTNADLVAITDIYSAGEPDTGAISGERVVTEIGKYHANVSYQPTLAAVTEFLTRNLQPGDICLCLGAGNLNQILPDLVDFYRPIVVDSVRSPSIVKQPEKVG